MKSLKDNNFKISDLGTIFINFDNICSILPDSYELNRSINNLILTKIDSDIGKYYPEFIHLVCPNYIKNFSDLMINMKIGFYNEKLFNDIFNKLCFIASRKINDIEIYKNLNEQNSKTLEIQLLKESYSNLFCSLIELSINHSVLNNSLIEPFLMLFDEKISYNIKDKTKKDSVRKNIYIERMFILFGKYNFDDILKKNEVSPKILDSYFKIIHTINNEVSELSKKVFKFIINLPNNKISNTKITEDEKIYDMLKFFYSSLSTIKENPEKDKEMKAFFLESDKLLEEELGYQLLRLKYIDKKYLMLSYLSEYNIHPNSNIQIGKAERDTLYLIESWLDYFITAINYKFVSMDNCEMFIKFLNLIHNSTNSINDESSLYDRFIKDAILSHNKLLKKFLHVVNFIFFPQNYYDVFEKHTQGTFTDEKLKDIIFKKYDLKNYQINAENKKSLINLSNDFKFSDKILFTDGIHDLIGEENDKELEEFLENYYFKNKYIINDDKNYELTHKHQMSFKFELYYDPRQLNIFVDNQNTEFNQNVNIYKTLMDLSKISRTIDYSVLNMSKATQEEIIRKFYFKSSASINEDLKDIELLPKNNLINDSLVNISDITTDQILKSSGYFEFLRELYNYDSNIKMSDLKKFKLNKVIEKLIRYFPIYPYFALFSFSTTQNPEILNWLILKNIKYKSTNVTDIQFENKIAYLKSQYDNILII